MTPFARTLTRRQVIVSLITDKAFKGILWAKRGPLLVLRNAAILAEDGPEGGVPVDGEVVIERSLVEFIQVIR